MIDAPRRSAAFARPIEKPSLELLVPIRLVLLSAEKCLVQLPQGWSSWPHHSTYAVNNASLTKRPKQLPRFASTFHWDPKRTPSTPSTPSTSSTPLPACESKVR